MEEKKNKKGISLRAGEITEEMKKVGGFCTNKFKADILTYGIDYSTLKVGDEIDLSAIQCEYSEDGEKYRGKSIRLTKVGKPCFDDCPVPKEKKPCILNHNVAFAEEVK